MLTKQELKELERAISVQASKSISKYTAPCELLPYGMTQKSFYGKAFIITNGKTLYLQSYETLVCKIDSNNNFVRMWNGYSNTTMKHINAFRVMNGMNKISKNEWERMEVR